MQRLVSGSFVAGLAALAMFAATSPVSAGAAQCGVGEGVDSGDGTTIYLTSITGRKGISCAAAQKIAEPALDKYGEGIFCKKRTYRAWKVTPDGFVHKAKFSKGKQRFSVGGQGAC